MSLRAVFLDRDGVITPKLDKGQYVLRPDQAVLNDGVISALRELQHAIPQLFIVTNQSCVGHGLISLEDAQAIHAALLTRLADEGITITDSRMCPHDDSSACACRKPKPGMIISLCEQYGISPDETAMIGDSITDVQAGQAAGCAEYFLLTTRTDVDLPPRSFVASSLRDAVSLLLQ